MIKTLLSLIADRFLKSESTDLKSHLNGTKKVKIHGVIFHIRKINILDYLEGARVLQEYYSTYKTKDEKYKTSKESIDNIKKAKAYMKDIIMAGVVKPKLVRKQEDDPEAILIDEVFQDFILVQKLSREILDFTHNKKKLTIF